MKWGFSYRFSYVRSKYRRKSSHKKKSRISNKQIWREYKQISRDKAKHGSWFSGPPRWMKRMCNKKHRQWERREIHHERYENLGPARWKRKDIFDRWLWD